MAGKWNELRRRRSRRWWLVGATLVAISVFSVIFVAASGANLATSPFEGSDGNLVVDGAPPATDWANVAGLQTLIDSPTGATDNSFTGGTHEDDPNVTIADGSIPPNKNDLQRAYLASETISGETFLYLAWERLVNIGSANIDFELNQVATPGWDASTTGALTINRTEGDILITYDFGGSGNPDLGLLTWLTAGHGHTDSDCEASGGKLPCWGLRVDLTSNSNPAAVGAVNTGTIDEPIIDSGATLGAGLFGEAKIDLSAIPGFFTPNTCKAFGSMFVKSRSSGSSIDAELKDFIAPSPIHVSNCGTVELKKTWVGTKGNATLKIGTTAGASDTASQALVGADGTTGLKAVEDGTYYMSESFDTPTNAGDYTTALACTDNGSPVTPGASNSVSVTGGHNFVCTFTNTRNTGSIELKKVWSGTKGNVTLKIGTSAGGSQTDSQALVAADGTTGAKAVDTGTYYVSESFDSPTSAGDYTTALACTDNGSPATPGTDNSLPVTSGHSVVCTFTNTRKQGSIELKKVWSGTKGNVTLKIGTTAGASDTASTPLVAADGTTGAKAVDTGTYYVSESFDSPTSAGDYTTVLACTDNGSPATPGTDNSLSVTSGHTVVCTFTNTRKQGSIELKKVWSGTKGNVTLKIGTTAGASDTASTPLVGADGTTGAKAVDTGTYYVSESFDSPTSAGDYTTVLACTDNGSPVTPGTDNSLSVTSGHTVVCTFTNTRNTGSIELKKTWVGDKGNVTLKIGTSAGASDTASTPLVGADGTTGAKAVNSGTYYVSEAFNTPTNAGDYDTSLTCTDNGDPVTPGASNSLAVASGHAVICTFTNSQRPKIELKKVWSGTKGNVTLKIGTSAGGSQTDSQALVGADGTTGTNTVDVGTYYVSESFDSPTSAGDYTTTLACTDNGSPVTPGTDNSLSLASGHSVVCTFTNTRNQASIELKKTWVGDKGNVTLKIGTSAGGSQTDSQALVGADGTTGTNTVDTGTYYVSESFDSPTNAGDYATSLDCVNGESPVTPGAQGSIAVGASDHVVCTFTNSRLPQLKLVKSLDPSNDSGLFDFAIGEQSFTNDGSGYGDQGTTGFVSIQPGAPVISESGHGGTSLSDYDSSISCDNGDSGDGTSLDLSQLSYGDKVTCTFTNVRRATIEIVKQALGSAGSFDFTLNDPQSEGSTPFTLAPDSSGGTDSADFSVSPGDYNVVEAAQDGWALTGLSCSTGQEESSDNGSQNESNPNQADIHVTAGGFVQCTYTNTRLATLIVKKVVDNSNGGGSKGPGDFSIHVTTGGIDLPGSPAAGSSTGTTYSGLLPGTYKVGEDSVSGYSLTSISGCLADGSIILDAGATVTCTLTNTSAAPPPPPPPPPPAPKIDLAITKAGTPNPATLGKSVTWTMVVTNNGPNGATGVTVADPIPAGTSFVSIATSQGSCTGGALVSCQLGSMPVGTSVTITLVTTATATGTLTNTATTVGNEAETNTANNTASASVRVVGPFVPPVQYCTAVAVSPKSIFVGRPTVLTMKISQHGKAVAGIRVRIKGSTLGIVSKPSNSQGLIKQRVQPKKAGIVVFTPIAKKSCANPRIGVIGVFTPPVTG